ncbi:CGNR zinc finger domain-containing protein [Paractinoplanes globisporus]|uniref:CGNR zinc finger domain-containing protein n=1 Tax=Paractinoplanes globisporus TaxID=113565 RepID=A0ABW6WUF8_9ACTN|nr:CGNR zinc finger domain-containing protein [Actinoplanes globisporus]
MGTTIVVMPMAELVDFVNEWGSLPRALDDREPSGDRVRTALADELHAVFAAAAPVTQASIVSGLLDRARVRPVLLERDGALAEEWTVDDPSQAARAAAALALRHQLAEHPGRIGICADDQCADVWVDASPAGRRRFCCLTCQNRARAAAFRRRHAG